MKKLSLIVPVLALVGCSAAAIKQDVRTAADVAIDACRYAYGQQPDALPDGVTAEQFCAVVEHYQPFLDSILSARDAEVKASASKH